MSIEVALEYQKEATDGRSKNTANVWGVLEGQETLVFAGLMDVCARNLCYNSTFSWMGLEQI
jgi:hypothetical protein